MRYVSSAAGVLCVGVLCTFPSVVQAQAYPAKPIRVLVGFASGGPTDVVVRAVAADVSARLGQTLVVENRPGAAGMIAIDALRELPADGYAIGPLTSPTVVASILAGKAANPVTAFTSIGYLWEGGIAVTANPSTPLMAQVRSMSDLVSVAKANPGKIHFSSAGTGSTGHLFGAMLASNTAIDLPHVGYKGLAPAIIDLMAGRIAFIVGSATNDQQLVQEGKLRILAMTGATRSERYPSVPSIAEAGFPDLVTTTWAGMVGPGGIPKAVADRLSSELKTTMEKTEIRRLTNTVAAEPRAGTAEEFAGRYTRDYLNFSRIIQAANIKVE